MNTENRRQNYRYQFPATERQTVALERAHPPLALQAELMDLGVEGMRLQLQERTSPLGLDDRVNVCLELPRLPTPLTISGAVVHLERLGDALICGIHFLSLLVPKANEERERTLSKFLMEEQRRRKKKGRSSGVRLKLFCGE